MYVCLCNGYRDKDIKDLARSGFRSAEDVYEALGGGVVCGACLMLAQELIDEHHAPAGPAAMGALAMEG